MDYHPVTGIIIDLLKTHHCWFETFEHEPVRTSAEAAQTRPGYSQRHGAKAMIVKTYRQADDFVMLVFPAHLKFDSKKVKHSLESKNLRFATPEEVGDISGGVLPGAVPPFGHLFNMPVIADPKLFDNEKIVFNAGDRRFSIAMTSLDYKLLANPTLTPITQDHVEEKAAT